MRLLNSRTLDFEFFGSQESRPKYAILSHRWGPDEVSYHDMLGDRALAEQKRGFDKIERCAERAINDGLDYVWVDTCCIDKTSSAELSEAINSMFRWYRNSKVCYAYLCDIGKPDPEHDIDLKDSDWFSRGWTLQELIAPLKVEFFDSSWFNLGSKADPWIYHSIHSRTTIPINVISTGDFSNSSVAQRMSWAAGRETTRPEDLAYCLLGLFDINMPLLYGEGTNAFLRLQEEIIRISDDMSVFAWTDPQASFASYSGLLAASPAQFSACQHVVRDPPSAEVNHTESEPYQVTNRGIRIQFELIRCKDSVPQDEYAAVLQGVKFEDYMPPGPGDKPETFYTPLSIRLQKLYNDQFVRVETNRLIDAVRETATVLPQTVFVRRVGSNTREIASHARVRGIILSCDENISLLKVRPTTHWDSNKMVLKFDGPQWSEKTLGPSTFKFSWVATDYMTRDRFCYIVRVVVDLRKQWGEIATFYITLIASSGRDGGKTGPGGDRFLLVETDTLTTVQQSLILTPRLRVANPEGVDIKHLGIELTFRRELVGQEMFVKMSIKQQRLKVYFILFFYVVLHNL